MPKWLTITPAKTALALLAIIALGSSTAYAASQINGKTITKHTIAGNRLKNNTVTGAEIKESTLGTVPRATDAANATTAANAANAANAAELGGKSASAYATASSAQSSGLVAIASDGQPHTFFTRAPITWTAICTESGGAIDLALSAASIGQSAYFAEGNSSQSLTATPKQFFSDSVIGMSYSNQAYSVLGPDGTTYAGIITEELGEVGTCGVSITALG